MNLHKLRQREELKNKREFPLKCIENDIKISFDNKKKECKKEFKSINNKIIKEYIKNKKTSNYLTDYIYNIDTRIFNSNLYPKEKNILQNLEKNYDMIKEYQEWKERVFIEDREILEDKVADLFKKEEKRENQSLQFITDETMFYFALYNKLKEDFLEDKKGLSKPIKDFDNLVYQNRHLKIELELIKNLNMKLKKILKNQRNIYDKIICAQYKQREISNKKNKKNKNDKEYKNKKEETIKTVNKKKIIRNIFLHRNNKNENNYYDIFNCNYYKSNKFKQYLKLDFFLKKFSKYTKNMSTTYKSSLSYSSNKSSKNKPTNKKLELKKSFSSNKILPKKNLNIQTNNSNLPVTSMSQKSIYKSTSTTRILSASSFKTKKLDNFKIKETIDNNNNYFDSDNDNISNEKIYLKKVYDFLKEEIEIKNDYGTMIGTLISSEIKTMNVVKDFLTKLIRDLRYDIDDINKEIKHNIKINVDNKDLEIKLKQNEKLLLFSTYFYDNCLKGNNTVNYLFNENRNNRNDKNTHKLFVTEKK